MALPDKPAHERVRGQGSGVRLWLWLGLVPKPGLELGLRGRSCHIARGAILPLHTAVHAGLRILQSTLLRLLLRLYNVDGGRICVDGTNIACVTLVRRLVLLSLSECAIWHCACCRSGRTVLAPEANPGDLEPSSWPRPRLSSTWISFARFISQLITGVDEQTGLAIEKLSKERFMKCRRRFGVR